MTHHQFACRTAQSLLPRIFLLVAGLTCPLIGRAASTNWIAYNDHRRGTTTAANVNTYTLGVTGTTGVPVGGPLTNFTTGQLVSPNRVGVSITSAGRVDGTNGSCLAPNAASPSATLFSGKVDWTTSALMFGGADQGAVSEIRFTFTNLTVGKSYSFRGSSTRGANYPERWTLATLAGVSAATPAHATGTGTRGIVTNGWAPYGDNLAPATQAAWNSGDNRAGDVIGWDDIQPMGNTFSVICSNFAPNPGGSNTNYTFAFNAFLLAEFEGGGCTNHVTIVGETPADVVVPEYGSFALAVSASGCITNFQYYKDGTPIANATASVYQRSNVVVGVDGGQYWVVVGGPNDPGGVESRHATVTVLADTNPACLVRAVAAPDPDNAGWDQMVVTFSKPINQEDAQNLDYYSVTLTGNPAAELAVVGVTPLTPTDIMLRTIARAPETDYTIMVTGVRDTTTSQNLMRPPCNALGVEGQIKLIQLEAAPPETAHFWRYNARGADLGIAWREARYDDSGWTSIDGTAGAGPGPLDAKTPARSVLPSTANNLSVGTVLASPSDPDMTARYFRTHVNVPAHGQDVSLQMRIIVDDGAVFYVNGREAYRFRMPALSSIPADAVVFSTLGVNISDPGIDGPFELPATNVVAGDNVIAVEVHQSATNSTDATFGMELLGTVRHYAASPVVLPRIDARHDSVARALTLTWTAGAEWKLFAADRLGGTWTKAADTSPCSVPAGSGMRFFRLEKAP